MIESVIAKWKRHLGGDLPGGLDELLHDDVVFYSPIVYTPQRGKAITTMYLEAAGQTLPGDQSSSSSDDSDGKPGRFRYTKEVLSGDTAVLEFETTVAGKYVNGVDIIRCDSSGRIVEFRVMIRPLQAVNLVHAQMAAMLESMAASADANGHSHDHGPSSFDDRAETWDDDPAKTERARIVADAIRARVGLDGTERFLEYGAGTGLLTTAIQESVGSLTMADTSEGMRTVMARKVADGTIRTARVWDLDLAGDGPLPDDRFDLAVMLLALHHVDDVPKTLGRIATMLEPGGHLCIVDLEREDGSFHGEGFTGHRGFDRSELSAQLAAAEFTDVGFEACHHIERDGRAYPMFLATATR